jgi:hypothetical protein
MARFDIGSGVSGAMSGGQIGTAVGGPYGGAIGATIGGTLGLFGSKKKKRKPKQISTLDPQQQELYGQQMAAIRGEGPMAGLYNYDVAGANQNFEANVARPAYRGFQENVIPGITGQFRQGNLQRSSYAGEALSRAGRDVQESLDAQRSGMIFQGQQAAQQNRQSAIENALNRQTFATQRPQERGPSQMDQILGKLAPNAGEWFADYLKGLGPTAGTAAPAV